MGLDQTSILYGVHPSLSPGWRVGGCALALHSVDRRPRNAAMRRRLCLTAIPPSSPTNSSRGGGSNPRTLSAIVVTNLEGSGADS